MLLVSALSCVIVAKLHRFSEVMRQGEEWQVEIKMRLFPERVLADNNHRDLGLV